MTTFENAKVGDKVYHYKYGWTVITQIMKESSYPIIMDYDFSFTYEGFADKNDKNPSLFWDEVIITPPHKPLPKLEVDTKVLVWEEGSYKTKAHFSHFDSDNEICVFSMGRTSWTKDNNTQAWTFWELVKD